MRMPSWLLRLLPIWEYICPKCRREVKKNSHKCPHCGELFPLAIRVPPSFLKDPKKLQEYVHKHVFPRVSKKQRDYLAQFFTVLFAHGFEGGDFGTDPETGDAWTGTSGSPTIITDPVHHGTYAMKATGTSDCYVNKEVANFTNIGFYCQFDGLSATVGQRPIRILTSGGTLITTITLENDRVGLYDWVAAAFSYWNNAFNANEWYYFEVRYVSDAVNGEFRLYVNGTERITITGKDTSARPAGDFRIGFAPYVSGQGASNGYFDCVAAADAPIGPEEEATLKTVTDAFSLSESVLCNKTLILSDSLELADSLYGNKFLLLSDSASLSELVTVIIGEVMKYVTDSVSSADVVSTPSRVLRLLEAIGATDNVAVNKVLQVTDTVSLAEIIEVGVGGAKKTRLFLILGDLAVQLTGD